MHDIIIERKLLWCIHSYRPFAVSTSAIIISQHPATMMHGLVVSFILFVVCFGVYYNSLDNEFVFDDHLAIVNNADTDPSTPFHDLWKHDIWGKDLMAHDSHRSYRPLLIITFKLLRFYFGLDARSIRIASILSHAMSSILVYFLGLQVLSNWHVSFASSLLFALHPVHVEVRRLLISLLAVGSLMYLFLLLLLIIVSDSLFLNCICLFIVRSRCGQHCRAIILHIFLCHFHDVPIQHSWSRP
jgi:hypothetical protein